MMDRTRLREIASKGGRAAHQKGTAHEWTREEAREAGRKGGTILLRGGGRVDAPERIEQIAAALDDVAARLDEVASDRCRASANVIERMHRAAGRAAEVVARLASTAKSRA